MNQVEKQACATNLAGMRCPTCGGAGGQEDGAGVCDFCHGTGYLFDTSVRVPCEGYSVTEQTKVILLYCPVLNPMMSTPPEQCACGGRGWTAPCRPEDFVKWCWALKSLGAHDVKLNLLDGAVEIWWTKGMPSWATAIYPLLTALAQEGATCLT